MSTDSKLFFLFLPNISDDFGLLGADDDAGGCVPRCDDEAGAGAGSAQAQSGDGDRERMFLVLAPVRMPWPAR